MTQKVESTLSEAAVRNLGWPDADYAPVTSVTAESKPKPAKAKTPKRKLRRRIARHGDLPSPFDIMRMVARREGLDVRGMLGDRTASEWVRARHFAMRLACGLRKDLSISELADEFRRNRTRLQHAQRKLASEISIDAAAAWQALTAGSTVGQIWPHSR